MRFGYTPVQQMIRLFGFCALPCLLVGGIAPAAVAQQSSPDLSSLSLDSLSSMEITSVSRSEQRLNEAAAAIYVITSDDIRRSGMSTLPELLRMAPGLEVATIDGNKWAITTRGFNERYSDRTLFLMDGRALYSPLTSGVSWDIENIPVAEIDRIEIIRGPGATLWGANAMDGVINIITRKSQDTQGALVGGEGAADSPNQMWGRYGGRIGVNGHYRISAEFLDRPGTPLGSDVTAPDTWRDLRAGFRSDWTRGSSTFFLEGQIYKGRTGELTAGDISLANPSGTPFPDQNNSSGGDLVARWDTTAGELSTSIEAYLDIANRNEIGQFGEYQKTLNGELNQRLRLDGRNNLSWGANLRYNDDDTVGSFSLSFNPANRDLWLVGAYMQDELTIDPGKLKLTAGGKLEHSYFNGFVFQPNLRLIWTPTPRVSVWSSAARAADSPSRIDADVRDNELLQIEPGGSVTLHSNFGTPKLDPETVAAYELGIRLQPHPKFNVDLATFYNHYSHFHTYEPGTPFIETGNGLPTHLVIPSYLKSNDNGMSRGVELLLEGHPASFWKVSASYTALLSNLNQSASSMDQDSANSAEGTSPRTQFQIHSLLNLPKQFEFDSALYYVGKLPYLNVSPHIRVDLRAGWKPTSSIEFSAGVQNLIQPRHVEWATGELVTAEPVTRSAFLKATWSF